MGITKSREVLIECLQCIEMQSATKTAIVLMLKSEEQILTMLDWLYKHLKENPEEEFVLKIAIKITEKVS